MVYELWSHVDSCINNSYSDHHSDYCDQQCDQCEFVFGNDSAAADGTTFSDVEQSVSRQ